MNRESKVGGSSLGGGERVLNGCLQRGNTAAIGERRMTNWRERAKAAKGTQRRQTDSWKPFKVCCPEIPQTWHYFYEEVEDKGLSYQINIFFKITN